jgi:hypothetical protein
MKSPRSTIAVSACDRSGKNVRERLGGDRHVALIGLVEHRLQIVGLLQRGMGGVGRGELLVDRPAQLGDPVARGDEIGVARDHLVDRVDRAAIDRFLHRHRDRAVEPVVEIGDDRVLLGVSRQSSFARPGSNAARAAPACR